MSAPVHAFEDRCLTPREPFLRESSKQHLSSKAFKCTQLGAELWPVGRDQYPLRCRKRLLPAKVRPTTILHGSAPLLLAGPAKEISLATPSANRLRVELLLRDYAVASQELMADLSLKASLKWSGCLIASLHKCRSFEPAGSSADHLASAGSATDRFFQISSASFPVSVQHASASHRPAPCGGKMSCRDDNSLATWTSQLYFTSKPEAWSVSQCALCKKCDSRQHGGHIQMISWQPGAQLTGARWAIARSA